MPDTLGKRSRESEILPDSTEVRESKRFNGEETDPFRHLPLLDKTLAEKEAASSEDVVSGVMRSLEEEISATFSTFYAPISVDNSSASDISHGYKGQAVVSDSGIDLCYLLEASDDDLGIPSGPVLDFKDEECQFRMETLSAEGLSENPDLKCQGEDWDFENEFENVQQFALYQDSWDASEMQDYINRDFVSQDMFSDGDFSAVWTLEAAGCMESTRRS